MQIIDGKKISEAIQTELNAVVQKLNTHGIIPHIVIIQVGDNPASNVYIRNKLKLCEKINVHGELRKFPESVTQQELIAAINTLNHDAAVNGILVQLPVPRHINEDAIIAAIDADKDVDCFHLINVGALWTSKKKYDGILPCTPAGIIAMLKYDHIPIAQKNVVIIGRSNIVGKPLAALFLLEDATVTICHSKTVDLPKICQRADILVSAIGKANFITQQYTNPQQVVIDVGMNRDANGKLCGDVDFNAVKDHVAYITPVPGGVGPMTITMLLKNLINVTIKQQKNNFML